MTFLLALITTWHCYIHICVLFLVPLSHQNVSAVQGPWPYVCSHIPEPTIGPRTDQALGSAVFVYYLTGDSCSVLLFVVVVIPLRSCVWLFETPWTAARQASLFFKLPEFVQTHVHWGGDAIQPSHPLPPPSSPAFNVSQHQGLFQRVGSLHQVAKVLHEIIWGSEE